MGVKGEGVEVVGCGGVESRSSLGYSENPASG